MKPIALFFCSLVSAVVFVGCSGEKPPAGPLAYPVKGKVVYRGQPARGFKVAFHPIELWEGSHFFPTGTTDENGEFQLQSYQPCDGAPAGEYVVTFECLQTMRGPDPDDVDQPTFDRLQGRYNNPQTSQYKVTVQEGENLLDPFVLQ